MVDPHNGGNGNSSWGRTILTIYRSAMTAAVIGLGAWVWNMNEKVARFDERQISDRIRMGWMDGRMNSMDEAAKENGKQLDRRLRRMELRESDEYGGIRGR